MNDENKESLKRILLIDSETLSTFNPVMFWFGHNGITISIDTNNTSNLSNVYIIDHNILTIDTNKASVINGSQKISNLILISQSIKDDFASLLKDYVFENDYFENLIQKANDTTFDTIKIHTCFLISDTKYIKGFTLGLNTQKPIEEGHIIAGSTTVKNINIVIRKYQVEISGSGEKRYNFDGYGALQLIKEYY